MTKSQRRRRPGSAIEATARRDGFRRLSLDRLMANSPEVLARRPMTTCGPVSSRFGAETLSSPGWRGWGAVRAM